MPNKTGGISMGEIKLQLYTGFICGIKLYICGNSKYIYIYNRVYWLNYSQTCIKRLPLENRKRSTKTGVFLKHVQFIRISRRG